MDQHLYTTRGPQPNAVLWRPREGSSIALDTADYRPFSHVVRTVHLGEALDICVLHGMMPKPIVSLSTLKSCVLPPKHLCKNLRVLWFGAKIDAQDEDAHDWYGNVEFAIPMSTVMERWKNLYLVEVMTAPTHSCTRILVTNSDYSAVLPAYDPCKNGGPWHRTPYGLHMGLINCRRYNSEGYNRHGHSLEFMIEVTPYGMGKILEESLISFRNHEEARTNGKHVCHRYRKSLMCPSPLSKLDASRLYFKNHSHLIARQPIATPRLSRSAEEYHQRFLSMEIIPKHIFLAPPPPSPITCNEYYTPFAPPRQGTLHVSHILQQYMKNGAILKHQQIITRGQQSMFRSTITLIRKPPLEAEEDEAEKLLALWRRGTAIM